MPAAISIDFISAKEALTSAEVLGKWRQAICETTNPRAALQTPEWVEYRSEFGGNVRVGVVRYLGRQIVGTIPLLEANYPLKLSSHRLAPFELSMRGAMLMGNAPLTPPIGEIYSGLFKALAEKTNITTICIPGALNGTEFASFLSDFEQRDDPSWFVYWLEPSNKYYCINMPPTFDDYYRKFDANMRRNFRRESKRLRELSVGELDLLRVERELQVAPFLRDATMIAETSWQKMLVGCPMNMPAPRFEVLTRLARQGMLRCYLLRCGDIPCAYAVAFQCNEVFYYYEIAFNPKFSKASPGKVLLYMVLNDLFAHNRPKLFYFGPGAFEYKRWFSNSEGEERTAYILRKSISNRTKVWLHRNFRSLVGRLKPST